MLLSLLCAVSFSASVLLCVGTGAFDTLAFLWLLPVGCVGCFLLLAALGFGFLLLYCRRIDPEQTWEEDTPWFRWLIMEYIHTILTVLPVRVRTRGMEKAPTQGRFLLVCNHLDNIDPVFLYYCFPKSQMAFIAKQETKKMFLVNKVMPKLLCPTINRENDREALKTILRCISLLKTIRYPLQCSRRGASTSTASWPTSAPACLRSPRRQRCPSWCAPCVIPTMCWAD